MKKAFNYLVIGALLASSSTLTGAQAATAIKNGTPCTKAGATSVVKVKGLTKTYICHTNPATPTVSATSWTLKTCISYYAAAQGQQDGINQQMPLIAMMSEPDKSTYTNALNQTQVKLNAVIAAINAHHCRAGL